MTAHTPGPWHLNGGKPYWIEGADDLHVADVATYADARLSAAAPELLEALEYIMDSTNYNLMDAATKARAAIAKARGESK
jgi:hypothetical protein